MHNFVECDKFVLISPSLERLPTKFNSMLHNFAAPVTNRAASTWTASKSVFDSEEQLSQTVSLYSKRGRIYAKYFFSRDFLETLNLRALNKFSLDQDFSDIDLTCFPNYQYLKKLDPGAYGKKYSLSLYHS